MMIYDFTHTLRLLFLSSYVHLKLVFKNANNFKIIIIFNNNLTLLNGIFHKYQNENPFLILYIIIL